MLVITAPGQGAQTPGFLSPWLDVPGVAERLAGWSELAGVDLVRYGTTGSEEEIRDTAV
ncbi:MAG TPA: ACP S-malonyltransferase, partial [Streptosporangiaceae bacterium]|nr:ACP S-malonyltransferase [Streptosporangiaceae bacterium]